MITEEQKPEPAIASRRDQLSIWSVVLIIAYFVLQAMTMAGHPPSFRRHKSLPTTEPPARSALDSDSGFKNLLTIDYTAKAVYFSDHLQLLTNDSSDETSNKIFKPAPKAPAVANAGKGSIAPAVKAKPNSPPANSISTPVTVTTTAPKPGSKPTKVTVTTSTPAPVSMSTSLFGSNKGSDQMTLAKVVLNATDALRDDPLDIDFARRLILLRAENGKPPLAPIPPKGKKAGLASPLAAYAPAPGTPPTAQVKYDQEAALWKDLFSSDTLPKGTDTASFVKRINAVPNLRWYKQIALHQLYLRVGDTSLATAAQTKAVQGALASEGPLVLILLTMLALLILGGLLLVAVILIGVFAARSSAYDPTVRQPIYVAWFERFTQPRQSPVPIEQRRLGAGDLMDVFVVYLFSGVAIGLIFDYLVTHDFQKQLSALSYNRIINFDIIAESSAYVLNGLIAYWLLLFIAKRRGASVADELGLSTKRLVRNAMFGVAGWSMGLALMAVITLVSDRVFQGAPEPTNPAVKLEVGSSGFLGHLLLFALASIAAPFFEELLFRGVFFNAARLKIGPWPAIVLTGLIFGFAHPVGAGQAMALSTLGAVFAWMAYTRKSLVPSMTAHFMQNTFASVVMWLAFLILQPG